MKTFRGIQFDRLFVILLFLAAGLLIFSNLDNIYLWQDEAETALTSRSIGQHLFPMNFDGRNIIKNTYPEAKLSQNLVEKTHSWLQHYLVFLSFRIFGENTLSARFPFALFGLLSVIFFYYFCRRHLESRAVSFIALVLFVFSVPLILHFRQCRYHAPMVFLAIASMDAYLNLLKGKKGALPYFVLTNVILFNSHFGAAASYMGGFVLHSLSSREWKGTRKYFIMGLAIIVLVNLPMVLFAYTFIWDKSGFDFLFVFTVRELLSKYLLEYTNNHIAPLILLAAWALIYVVNPNGRRQGARRLSLFAFILISHFCLLLSSRYLPYFRNLVPMIPLFLIILAQFFYLVFRRFKIGGVAMILLFVTTDIFSLPVTLLHERTWTRALKNKVNFALMDFIDEITHDYDGPVEGIVRYLKQHARNGDLVVTNYADLPLMFYTNLRVMGGYGEVGLSDQQEYRERGVELVEKPDWIVLRRGWPVNPRYFYFLRKYRYKEIEINAVDILWENRPDPSWHQYRSVTKGERVKIFQLSE
ncbi:glycosyltransferase family 39 protein [Acidobacteria bacterium AH-259-L09]|nr:glycosyltransferase family 39 protein [Acidobacteria bacterium AH-259-L09]